MNFLKRISENKTMLLIFFTFTFGLLGTVSSARSGKPKCAWNEYYDDIMDSCGPCHEICEGVVSSGKVTLGTEDQCREDCADYLYSLTCTKVEYYDEHVGDCAPCSEVCDSHEYTKTTADCLSKCTGYFPEMEKGCTDEQYFSETDLKCMSCSDLCTFNETGGTSPDCFHKCHRYVEKHHPVFRSGQNDDPSQNNVASSTQDTSSPSSLHPGFIIAVAIIVVVVLAVAGVVAYRGWNKHRSRDYTAAPNTDDRQNENSNQCSVPMQVIGTSIQVSHEGLAQQTTRDDGQSDIDQQFGRPELDPLAPSSAAGGRVFSQ